MLVSTRSAAYLPYLINPEARMRRFASFFVVVGFLLSPVLARSQTPAPTPDLAAHRAIYQLTLASARGDIVAAGGSMAYEMIDACDGWTVRQRLRITITDRENRNIEMGTDYATLESKDGLTMRFNMRQTAETAVTSETEGTASLLSTGAAGEAKYKVPGEATKPLPPGTMFPTMHTVAILEAARAGKKFLAIPLFDGTVATGSQDTSVAIFSWDPPKEHRFPVLAVLPSTRVRIAFFDKASATATPDYELGMRYWENGIADDMTMDFGDFVLRATMIELSVLPKNC